jgi:hypothetical protein
MIAATPWTDQLDKGTSLEERMGELHEEVIDRVDDAVAIGERGVLAAGDLLGAIVREALAQGEETSGLLAHTNASKVTEALEQEAVNAEKHIAAMDGILSNLSAQTSAAIKTTQAIGQTVGGFREVLMSTRMVGISLRIEVARLPNHGDLAVIPDQLRSLGEEIESLTGELESLIASLRAVLPALEASNTRVARARNLVRVQVADSVAALGNVTRAMCHAAAAVISNRSDTTATIRLRCEAALSRLQFFDPMVQNLQRLDTLISDYRSSVTHDGLTKTIEPVRYGRRLGDSIAREETVEAMQAGELMLF